MHQEEALDSMLTAMFAADPHRMFLMDRLPKVLTVRRRARRLLRTYCQCGYGAHATVNIVGAHAASAGRTLGLGGRSLSSNGGGGER